MKKVISSWFVLMHFYAILVLALSPNKLEVDLKFIAFTGGAILWAILMAAAIEELTQNKK